MGNITATGSNGLVFEIVQRSLEKLPISEQFTKDNKDGIIHSITDAITSALSNDLLKERLEILYDYEKKYLELTKTYKEEIKFAAALQEDIRKERSKFFSDVLQDVHKTLEEVKMDKKATDLWISELVTSYTKSLDISSDLAKDHVLDMMGILRDSSKGSINKISDKEDKKGG
jgi:hypothetical protein